MIFYGLVGASLEQQILLVLFLHRGSGSGDVRSNPIYLGKGGELHPMILVMAILICGSLFGGIGLVLAVPMASTAKILIEEFVLPSFVELSKKVQNRQKVIKKKAAS